MDLTLLYWAIALFVVGFVVGLVGLWIQQREAGGLAEEPLGKLLTRAIRELFTSIRKMFRGTVGDRVQAFGSVLAWAGAALFVVFVVQQVAGSQA